LHVSKGEYTIAEYYAVSCVPANKN